MKRRSTSLCTRWDVLAYRAEEVGDSVQVVEIVAGIADGTCVCCPLVGMVVHGPCERDVLFKIELDLFKAVNKNVKCK